MQSKLLRVLQKQEFERLGSTRTLRVDVRWVAATNRDLTQMVTDKEFHSDLYYRLNVFPIAVPPLRERPQDIPLLVRYFAQHYARRMRRRIETIPAGTLAALSHYHWPGNIRELENLIERSKILSQGPDLHVPLEELKAQATAAPNGVATLEAAEREHILRALQEAHWAIGGPTGAAARLGMKRTTLQSRMKKLGISRRSWCRYFGRAASAPARLSSEHPLWPKRKTLFSFSGLADFCTVEIWLERGLPREEARLSHHTEYFRAAEKAKLP